MSDMYNNENGNYGEAQNDPYQQPVQQQLQYQYQRQDDYMEEPMTMGDWLITLLIMMIPCVNIIMAFVWAFSSKERRSKSNYFKAYLIILAIQIVLSVIAIAVYGTVLISAFSGGYYY